MQVCISVLIKMAHKETRKIITFGNSLAITLPQPWLNFYDIKPGDYVEIITFGTKAEIKLIKNGNKDYQPKHDGKMGTSLEGGEENPEKGGDMHGNRKEEKIQNMDETGGKLDEKQLS